MNQAAVTTLVTSAFAFASVVLLPHQSIAAGDDKADRGSYLVHNVAMCTDCHGSALHGGVVPGSTLKVPSLVRGAGLSESQIASILQHGTMPPPMPHYQMNASDAAAIARYIVSVR